MWTSVSVDMRKALAALSVAAMALGSSSIAAAADSSGPPDISGTWSLIRHTGPQGQFFMPADPPLNANGQKIVSDFRAKYDVHKYDMEPNGYCVEHGMPSIMWGLGGAPIYIIQQPKRITLLSEATNQFRFMFLDGRKPPKDYPHTRNGYAVGHWDGDTLVIDTVGFNEDFWFDRRGLPHTTALHTIERFTRKDERETVYEIEVHDPNVYTAPYTGGFSLRWNGGTELFEYVCQQANYASELMVGGGADSIDRSSTIIP